MVKKIGMHKFLLENDEKCGHFLPLQEPFSLSPRGFGETLSWGITKLLSFLSGTYKIGKKVPALIP